jgi:hypothetical protein
MKNLKNFRINSNLMNLSNTKLPLNESLNNFDDINSLDMDLIEETILKTFKGYRGFSENKEKKNLLDLNSKSDSDYRLSNNSKMKNKIFDTSKISKKNERFMDENEENYINDDNNDISNLIKSMNKDYDRNLCNQASILGLDLGLGQKKEALNINLNGVRELILPGKLQLEEMNSKGNILFL